MLDRKLILQDPESIKENCRRRGVQVDVDQFVALEKQRLEKLQEALEYNRLSNESSKGIGAIKDPAEREQAIARGRELRQKKDAANREVEQIEAEVLALQSRLPNLTHPDVPVGGEADAKEIKFGKTPKPKFDFPVQDHLQIAERLSLVDFEAGARVAGAGFYFLQREAAMLDLALQQFTMQLLVSRGFIPIVTPDLALTSILHGIGFNPRGPETQIYSIEGTELNLVATAEITLGGMLAGQTLEKAELPLKMCGLSHCFRTEAGAAGRASRGLYRVHQFTKVEMFAFTLPDQSDAIHDEFRELECEIFDQLGIPFRVIDTASGDLGGPAYRKFDLEAWMPGRGNGGEWGEVTSTSNCTDYQARRLDIRFRTPGQKGTDLVHTLNGTAVATGRAIIAILENYQQSDGSVAIPEVLRPWVGKSRIGPR